MIDEQKLKEYEEMILEAFKKLPVETQDLRTNQGRYWSYERARYNTMLNMVKVFRGDAELFEEKMFKDERLVFGSVKRQNENNINR